MTEPTDEYLNEVEGWQIRPIDGVWYIEGINNKNQVNYDMMKFVIAKAIADNSSRHKKYLGWIRTYSESGWKSIEACAELDFGIKSIELNKLI